jgi:hypothetical protein
MQLKLEHRWFLKYTFILFFLILYSQFSTLNCIYAADGGKIQLSVPSPGQLKAGEMITFQVLVLNEGSTIWNTGTYSSTIDIYDAKKVYKVNAGSTTAGPAVAPGESALFFLSFKVPENFGGEYFYKVNLRLNKSVMSTSDYFAFNVLPVVGAVISITNTIGEQKFSSNFKIVCQVKNTGETGHKFPVTLEFKNSAEIIIISTKMVSLSAGQFSAVEFDCSVSPNYIDGNYTAIASVYNQLEVEKPVQKYNEASQEFKVIDTVPTVQFLNLGLSAVKSEEISLKVRVTDDKDIQDVRIGYQLPGMPEKKTQNMDLLSGTKQDGVWVFKTAAFTETGKFTFTIEATDSKSQTHKAEYQATVVTQ